MRQRLSNPSPRGRLTLGYTYGPSGARYTVRTSDPMKEVSEGDRGSLDPGQEQ
jgi:hypothetical protein